MSHPRIQANPRVSIPIWPVLLLLALTLLSPARAIVLPPPSTDADPGFTSPVFKGHHMGPVAFQSDDRLLIATTGLSADKTELPHITRLRRDGSIDPTFRFTATLSGTINALLVLPDDRVLVGGYFTVTNGATTHAAILRIEPDGAIDRSFRSPQVIRGGVSSLARDGHGRIVVGGFFFADFWSETLSAPQSRTYLTRLLPEGTLDPEFGSELYGGHPNVRINASLEKVHALPDGRVLLWGGFSRVYDTPRPGLAMLNADGSLDRDFQPARASGVADISVSSDNRVMLAGDVLGYAGLPAPGIVRLLPTGGLDPAYKRFKDSADSFGSILIDSEGGITALVSTQWSSPFRLARFFPDGELDTAFASPSITGVYVTGLHRAPSGSLHRTIVSNGRSFSGDAVFRIERILVAPPVPLAPVLKSAPAPLTLEAGQTAVLEIETTAHPRPTYQWQRGGTDIANATNRLLHIDKVTAGDADAYRLIVKNNLGTLTTPALVLTVKPPTTAPGSISRAFDPGVILPWDVQGVEVLEDGRMMVYGAFSHVQGQKRPGLALVGSDGKLDPGFVPDTEEFDAVRNVKPSIRGGWLVTGLIRSSSFQFMPKVIRLTATGARDPGFTPTPIANPPIQFLTAPTPNGGVYIAPPTNGVSRLNPDGSPDASFSVPVVDPAIIQSTADGRLWIIGGVVDRTGAPVRRLVRILPDGTPDPTLEFSLEFKTSTPSALFPLANGGAWVLDAANPQPDLRLVRLKPDGSIDRSFRPELDPTWTIGWALPLRSGGILVSSVQDPYDRSSKSSLARLHPDGSLDTGFGAPFDGGQSITLQAEGRDGAIVATVDRPANPSGLIALNGGPSAPLPPSVLGWPNQPSQSLSAGADLVLAPRLRGSPQPHVQWFKDGIALPGETNGTLVLHNIRAAAAGRYHLTAVNPSGAVVSDPVEVTVEPPSNTPGSVDPNFFSGDGPNGRVNTALELPDGKWLIAGDFSFVDGRPRPRFARLNPDGSLDPSFDPPAGPDGEVVAAARLADGTLILGGRFQAVGPSKRTGLASFSPEGTLSPTLWNASGYVTALQVLGNGQILVGTGQTLTRHATNGSVIASSRITINGESSAMASQTNGQWIVVGNLRGANGGYHRGILRFNPDGKPDPTFNHGPGANSAIETVLLQPDGKILIAGSFTRYNGEPCGHIARLNPDGTLDPSFVRGAGAADGRPRMTSEIGWIDTTSIHSLALESDGRIVIGGEFTSFNGAPAAHLARLLPDGTLDPTFDIGNGIPVRDDSDEGSYQTGNSSFRDRWVTQVRSTQNGGVIVVGGFPSIDDVPRPAIARLIGGASPATAPQVHTPASDVVLSSGQDLTLKARFSGELPVAIQWYRNQEAIPGATNNFLNLQNLHPESAAGYSYHIRNGLGETFSPVTQVAVTSPVRKPASVDTRFRVHLPPGSTTVSVDSLPDGSTLLVTGVQDAYGHPTYTLLQLSPEGKTVWRIDDVTRSFTGASVQAAVSLHGGDALVFGSFQDDNDLRSWALLRVKPDGRIEPRWDPALSNLGPMFLRLKSGKLLVVVGSRGPTILRLNPDGSVDPTFKMGVRLEGTLSALVEEPSGSILLGGHLIMAGATDPGYKLIRLTAEGALHPSALHHVRVQAGWIDAVACQSDGSIVIAGSFGEVEGVPRPGLARLSPEGTLDPAFPKAGVLEPFVSTQVLLVLPDDAMMVGSVSAPLLATTTFRMVRVTPDGEIDLEFDQAKLLKVPWSAGSNTRNAFLRPTPTGKLLVFGAFAEVGGLPRQSIARFHLDQQPRLGLIPGPNRLVWDEGQLEQTEALGAPWQPVPDAASPLPLPPDPGARFYRLRLTE